MKKQFFILLLVFIGVNSTFAQKSKYFEFGTGLGTTNYIDFATSPLEYSGPLFNINTGYFSQSKRRETEWGVTFGAGLGLDQTMVASKLGRVFKLDFDYSKLFAVSDTDKWNAKVGARLNFSTIFRINSALLNNAVGIDYSPSLMATGKITRDLSSSRRKRALGFKANIGVINGQYRNNYIYAEHGAVLNGAEYKDASFDLLKSIRLNTELDYTYKLSNKNAISLAYVWDAYKTTGVKQNFQIATHTVKFTLLFNTNNQ